MILYHNLGSFLLLLFIPKIIFLIAHMKNLYVNNMMLQYYLLVYKIE